MVSQKYFPIVTTFIFSVVMSTVMSTAMPFVNTGRIPFPEVLTSILLATIVSFVAGLIVPVGKMGADYANQKNIRQGSLAFILVSSVLPTIYFTIIMTFVFTLQRTGFTNEVWGAFVGDILIALVIAYITTVISTPLIKKLSLMIASK